ncbi:MAG: cell division protein ZapE [Pseudohongiellaceae bacterium]|jgi:cell division protein ZapE
MISPRQKYTQDLDSGLIVFDAMQEQVVLRLQFLFDELVANAQRSKARKPGLSDFLIGWMFRSAAVDEGTHGLYIWGGVGRGKTYLMDLFFECLPFEEKQRTHFHRFMQFVHAELTALQGQKNPLDKLADLISSQARVLCFDEFFVLDIGDAMILAGLLDALFKRHVVLVTTSNINPDGLYENGLQRRRFIPAIELLKKHTAVIELASGLDYRLRSLESANLYLYPITPHTNAELNAKFAELSRVSVSEKGQELIILDRPIKTRRQAGDIVWFEFDELCGGPRSAFDYIELAKLFHTIIIGNVPAMGDDENDCARRFVSLIDELYDRRVKLVMSAQVPIEALYSGRSLAFAFERTQSRLLEMQSHDYLSYAHLA